VLFPWRTDEPPPPTGSPFCAYAAFLLLVGCVRTPTAVDTPTVRSPDGKVVIDLRMEPEEVPVYRITHLGKPIVPASRLGFETDVTNRFRVPATTVKTRHGR
jgi:Glycosyl-hydrolase 97 N-terminal